MSALNPIGKPFIELLSVESTNNYAMGLARAGMAQHGTAVFTHDQLKGKGQRERGWASEKGKNIALSLIVEPKELLISEAFVLSMMAAISVREFVEQYANKQVKIKWPNDIYCCDRKAAGILIENIWQGEERKFSIIGIGININQTEFGELKDKAVSLKMINNQEFLPVELAKQLCKILEERYQLLLQSPSSITKEYKSQLYKINQLIRLKKDNRIFEATVKDVSVNGELVVTHAVEEKFNVGEVEWMVSGA